MPKKRTKSASSKLNRKGTITINGRKIPYNFDTIKYPSVEEAKESSDTSMPRVRFRMTDKEYVSGLFEKLILDLRKNNVNYNVIIIIRALYTDYIHNSSNKTISNHVKDAFTIYRQGLIDIDSFIRKLNTIIPKSYNTLEIRSKIKGLVVVINDNNSITTDNASLGIGTTKSTVLGHDIYSLEFSDNKDKEKEKNKNQEIEYGCFYNNKSSFNNIKLGFVAYEIDYESIVKEKIKEYEELTAGGITEVSLDKKYKVVLTSPDINNLHQEQEFIWKGKYSFLYFNVNVDSNYSNDNITFDLKIKRFNQVIASIRISINRTNKSVNDIEKENNKAFISYSSKDGIYVDYYYKVLYLLGIHKKDIFYDKSNLEHGDNWKKEIEQTIRDTNIMYLFWSKNAKESPFVRDEYEEMINQHGVESIRIIPVENITPEDLPEELRVLHIDKELVDFACRTINGLIRLSNIN